MRHPTNHIFEQTPETLRGLLAPLGLPAFRAAQILDWVYGKAVADPAAMTNLSKRDRALVGEHLTFVSSRVVRDVTGTDGTRKLLVDWTEPDRNSQTASHFESDAGCDHSVTLPLAGSRLAETFLAVESAPNPPLSGLQTECVMIPTESRRTACISSQVGCPVGCRFCASGIGGVEGNLSAGRIVEQVWLLHRDLHVRGNGRITNAVFMGMGEPLANYNAVVAALRVLVAPWGLNISGRKITISTVGLPAGIERLAHEDLPVTLAISLHAPNDELRRELIPWAEYTTIDELLDAGRYYFQKTGREITLEYILLGGINDRAEHASELAKIARTLRANVNLIRYNEVAGLPYARPADGDVRRFQRLLVEAGVNTHIRASRGRDIAAACGQLRHEQRAGRAVAS